MALSVQVFTGIAAQQTYTFGVEFFLLSADHLQVTIDGTPAAFSVNAAKTQITLVPAIAGGEEIQVRRITPNTLSGRLVDFQDGSGLRQADLDNSSLQLLGIAQELLDDLDEVIRLGAGSPPNWEGQGLRLANLAPGIDPTDGATKSQLDAVAVAFGNLPPVSGVDNDSGLFVFGGVWAKRSPSQSRTHLGLGTAAVLNAGVAASNLPQLDGSARYPAADGRNIDLTAHPINVELLRRHLDVSALLEAASSTSIVTPAASNVGTWKELNATRIAWGSAVSLGLGSDLVIDGVEKEIDLAAGTWEIGIILRIENVNVTPGTFQESGYAITDDDDSATQVLYWTEYADVDVASPPAGQTLPMLISDVILVKLSTAKSLCFRARANTAGTVDTRITEARFNIKKVSDSFA